MPTTTSAPTKLDALRCGTLYDFHGLPDQEEYTTDFTMKIEKLEIEGQVCVKIIPGEPWGRRPSFRFIPLNLLLAMIEHGVLTRIEPT